MPSRSAVGKIVESKGRYTDNGQNHDPVSESDTFPSYGKRDPKRQTVRQIDRYTDRQIDRYTDREIDR